MYLTGHQVNGNKLKAQSSKPGRYPVIIFYEKPTSQLASMDVSAVQ